MNASPPRKKPNVLSIPDRHLLCRSVGGGAVAPCRPRSAEALGNDRAAAESPRLPHLAGSVPARGDQSGPSRRRQPAAALDADRRSGWRRPCGAERCGAWRGQCRDPAGHRRIEAPHAAGAADHGRTATGRAWLRVDPVGSGRAAGAGTGPPGGPGGDGAQGFRRLGRAGARQSGAALAAHRQFPRHPAPSLAGHPGGRRGHRPRRAAQPIARPASAHLDRRAAQDARHRRRLHRLDPRSRRSDGGRGKAAGRRHLSAGRGSRARRRGLGSDRKRPDASAARLGLVAATAGVEARRCGGYRDRHQRRSQDTRRHRFRGPAAGGAQRSMERPGRDDGAASGGIGHARCAAHRLPDRAGRGVDHRHCPARLPG